MRDEIIRDEGFGVIPSEAQGCVIPSERSESRNLRVIPSERSESRNLKA
jgi:hypothetical protein